jgi:hypothetical protein
LAENGIQKASRLFGTSVCRDWRGAGEFIENRPFEKGVGALFESVLAAR